MSTGEVWIYLGFFATLVAAGMGLPAPEEIVIISAGVLAGQLPPEPDRPQAADIAALLAANPQAGSLGAVPWTALARVAPYVDEPVVAPPPSTHVRWWILLPVCILGVVLSDIVLYTAGRYAGDWLLSRPWMARALSPSRRARTEENFHRYGVSLLVFGRLVPGIRAPLFLTAGSMRLPLPRFLLADGLGAIVGNSLFFFLGFWVGDSIKTLIERAEEKSRPILIIVGIGLLVLYLLWLFLRHPVSTGDPEEVPIIGHQVASQMEHTESSDNHCPPQEKPNELKKTENDAGK